jgi:hypothetical protein
MNSALLLELLVKTSSLAKAAPAKAAAKAAAASSNEQNSHAVMCE